MNAIVGLVLHLFRLQTHCAAKSRSMHQRSSLLFLLFGMAQIAILMPLAAYAAPAVTAISSRTVDEGNSATFTVSLSETVKKNASFFLSLGGGTASAASDYSLTLAYSTNGGATYLLLASGGTAHMAIGTNNFLVKVVTLTDTLAEPTETFTLTVTPSKGATGRTLTGTGSITNTPTLSTTWTFCANEGGVCNFSGAKQVRFGLGTSFTLGTFTASVGCDNAIFGDPLPGANKICEYAMPVNAVQLENAKLATQGVTDAWLIANANYATNHEIEGYASATSVARGGTINLFVNTLDPSYTLNVYRIGWYGGAGGRLVHSSASLSGTQQAACPMIDTVNLLIECNWTNAYPLAIPNSADSTDWASGFYLAKLTGSSGKQSYIVFVVRDDTRNADLMFQSGVTTYAAYNRWGGYGFYSTSNARKLSFNRPYAHNPQIPHPAIGSGDFFGWDIYMVRFLEKEGYNVTYSTDIDTHTSGNQLTRYKGFLSVGHDEYWTKAMRDAVEGARNQGVNLGFFGANVSYWQVRLEPSSTGQANRTVVGYRFDYGLDPYYNTVNQSETTALWRNPILNRPEAAMIGVQYDYNSVDLDMVISDCSSWICNGTGLLPGDKLAGMLGYEVDRLDAASPAGIIVLTSSPYVCVSPFPNCTTSPTRYSNMTYYTAPSSAGVFATGSMNWNFGLSAFGPFAARANPAVQQITRNVLNRFISPRGTF